jgi:hypothetical protein
LRERCAVAGGQSRVSRLYDLTRPLSLHGEEGISLTAVVIVPTLTGYTFQKCLERSPLGEMWSVRGPEGNEQIAFYLRAGDGQGENWRLDRLRVFEHADIPGYEIIEAEPGRTVLLTEGYERTLQDRFQEVWLQKQPGIPRHELLEYLGPAATALDAVHKSCGFQHLGLNPAKIWLSEKRVRVAGFGLIYLLWLPSGKSPTELNARYCAPELSRGHVSRRCDQYSLALIYAELLTGVHPLEGPVQRRRQPGKAPKLDLSLLPSGDREILARALHPRPSQRFASCSDLVEALEDATETAPLPDSSALPAALPAILRVSDGSIHLASTSTLPATTLNQFIMELVAAAAGQSQLAQSEAIRYRIEPGRSLEHRCSVQMFPGALPIKLEGFQQQWKAQGAQRQPGCFAFTVTLRSGFWQHLTGRRIGLEIEIECVPAKRGGSRRHEVVVVVRPFGCSQAQATQLLAETGPAIVDSVRKYLQACPEQRGQDRLAIKQPLRVSPVLPGMQLAEPIQCMGKDISTHGIGFYLPHPPTTSQVYINLPELPQLASLAGLAHIVRGQPCGDGWYEIGASFAGDGPGKK